MQTQLNTIIGKRYEVDHQIHASLTEEEFDTDVLIGIEHDMRIYAFRTLLRPVMSLSPSAGATTGSPVNLP